MSNISAQLINNPDGLKNTTSKITDITAIPDSQWGDVNTLLNYGPSNFIKAPNQINIQSIVDASDVNIDAEAMDKYYNTLYSGKNTATTVTNNDQPLGQRSFTPSGSKCNYNGQQVDKTYVVDTMNYYQNSDKSFDTTNTGMLSSSFGALQNINTNTHLKMLGPAANNCVQVTIQKDGTPGNNITNYVSKEEYDRLNCTIFPRDASGNFCKTYSGNSGCATCSQKENPNPRIDSSVEGFGHGHGGGGGGGHHGHGSGMGHHGNLGGATVATVGYGYQNWYPLYVPNYYQPEYIYNSGLYNGVVYEVVDDDTIRRKKELVANDDFITQFYLGSITVLGLFILYKLMQRND
jgi:hypothetical protein